MFYQRSHLKLIELFKKCPKIQEGIRGAWVRGYIKLSRISKNKLQYGDKQYQRKQIENNEQQVAYNNKYCNTFVYKRILDNFFKVFQGAQRYILLRQGKRPREDS